MTVSILDNKSSDQYFYEDGFELDEEPGNSIECCYFPGAIVESCSNAHLYNGVSRLVQQRLVRS
jgi:hypothetical protein